MTGELKNAVDALDAPAPDGKQPEARKKPTSPEKLPKPKKDLNEGGEQDLAGHDEGAKGRQR